MKTLARARLFLRSKEVTEHICGRRLDANTCRSLLFFTRVTYDFSASTILQVPSSPFTRSLSTSTWQDSRLSLYAFLDKSHPRNRYTWLSSLPQAPFILTPALIPPDIITGRNMRPNIRARLISFVFCFEFVSWSSLVLQTNKQTNKQPLEASHNKSSLPSE